MKKGAVEMDEDMTLDGKIHRYYRIKDDVNLTVTYSFKTEFVVKKDIIW